MLLFTKHFIDISFYSHYTVLCLIENHVFDICDFCLDFSEGFVCVRVYYMSEIVY